MILGLKSGIPRHVEFFAFNDIANLNGYDFGSTDNDKFSNGSFIVLNGSAKAGDFLYASTNVSFFVQWFGFPPNTGKPWPFIIGKDVVKLLHDGDVVDVFGDVHFDGWAYRKSGTGPVIKSQKYQMILPCSFVLGRCIFRSRELEIWGIRN